MMATSEFGKAFAAARKAGGKTFEFGGKKYTTKTAEDAAGEKKETSNAKQRERSDMLVALTKAEKEAPAGTSDLAKQKIAESKRKVVEDIATAGKAEDMKAYKPRPTSGEAKQTTSAPAAKSSEPVAKPSAPAASAGRGVVRKSDSSDSAVGNIFKAIRERGDADLRSRGMKAGGSVKKAKGSSINGIAQRGLTKCKTV